ncbi:hypothetical protein DAI18_17770 [Microvirgula aerodenitrificans]|uniref:Uncharacterized protein n=1 Tax=Microvirgula aerodenitrificans TaxID=57480 RepID=A0A2S0PE76_9NEIS|nr:hypothetical protein DAI18_17770 [Microvirgula aerodenitrificans]
MEAYADGADALQNWEAWQAVSETEDSASAFDSGTHGGRVARASAHCERWAGVRLSTMQK